MALSKEARVLSRVWNSSMLVTIPFTHIVDEPENGELLLHWLGASEERVVGTTGWESEEDEAFEDFVQFD